MDAGYGGPVWHASIARHDTPSRRPVRLGTLPSTDEHTLRVTRSLSGVGDATLGEWWEREPSAVAVHVRRRVSFAEAQLYGLDVVDVRGTDEHVTRAFALASAVPGLDLDAVLNVDR